MVLKNRNRHQSDHQGKPAEKPLADFHMFHIQPLCRRAKSSEKEKSHLPLKQMGEAAKFGIHPPLVTRPSANNGPVALRHPVARGLPFRGSSYLILNGAHRPRANAPLIDLMDY